jgi:hypothetical protein
MGIVNKNSKKTSKGRNNGNAKIRGKKMQMES